MNRHILNSEVQDFIDQNLHADIPKLVLQGSPFAGVSVQELAEQIAAKSASKVKLPTWFATNHIYYPNKLNIEQSSSEITAGYKKKLISGTSLTDLTGGMGVDSYFFSESFEKILYCEKNEQLSLLTEHNFKVLSRDHIRCYAGDGIELLKSQTDRYDWIYLDPSRRNELRQKVFLLNHCSPDVMKNWDLFLKRSDQVMLKLSPMLDLKSLISQLKYVYEIHVVAVQNEVKELLILVRNGYEKEIKLLTVNLTSKGVQQFEAVFGNRVESRFSLPLTYLYEPNSAILKAGLFNQVSSELNVYKLHLNSHLYTSNELIEFPGRSFIIEEVFKFNLKFLRKKFGKTQAHITTRNFKYQVEELRKLTKIKDGGDRFLFFTIDLEERAIVISCRKV